ncbi:MAG: GDP-mannose 4,6-dehydratase [Armatimonadetes bacterium]|nr:GDP-mannose 4,6-dehydratase [Armatimonadota bacterium]
MKNYLENYRNKKIMITGGLGFLGSNLAHSLVKVPCEIILIDAMLPLYGGNYFNIEEIKEKLKIEIADIRDKDKMNELVKGQDYIFNIAGQVSHLDSMSDPFLDLDINARGNLVLLEACRKYNSKAKIIYAGTRGQYGKLEYVPVDEKHKMEPTDIYGVNKMAAEHYHLIYNRIYGIRSASLRINNTYGPRHQMKHGKYGILNWFIRIALENGTIKIFGDGNQLRDYNYVDDVVKAMLLTGSNEKSAGNVYNLGSGKQIKFIELVEEIIKTAGNGKIEKVPWPKERADIEIGDYAADFSKIKKELNWEPKVSLDEGLKKTIEFYKRNKEHYW